MRQKTALLLGSYGQTNLGDDLLMWNYLQLLRDRGFTDIYVNANVAEFIPKVIRQTYPNLHIIDTYNTSILDYVRFIQKADCVVYGGGTLYKELYASTGRSKYSVITRMMGFNILARLLGARLYHLHIGIGSLKTWWGRVVTKLALAAATYSLFRDQRSYHFAKNPLHVNAKKLGVSTDGLFINHVWEKPWRRASLRIDRKQYKRVVGVNVLSDIPDWVDREQYLQVMQKFVVKLLERGDYIVFMPFQHAFNPHNDLAFIQDAFGDVLEGKKGYKILQEVPIDLASSYLQQCDVFVGMRFHSLLLSCVNKVPFVAVAYDTKCWRFIEEIGYEHAIKLEQLELAKLTEIYNQAVASRSKTKRQLGRVTQQLYAEAEEGLRTLDL